MIISLILKIKVTIVTGGSKGIGEGCVRVFVAEGSKVKIINKNERIESTWGDSIYYFFLFIFLFSPFWRGEGGDRGGRGGGGRGRKQGRKRLNDSQ